MDVYRACTEAWAMGGLEAERKERDFWQTQERRKIQDSLDALTLIRENAPKNRLEKEQHKKGMQIQNILRKYSNY